MRKWALLEPVAVFLLIMAYIWDLRYSHRGMWVAILALMIVSHMARRERAAAWRDCWREFAPLVAFCTLAMYGAGVLLQTTRPIGFDRALLAWIGYLPWGLFQQYILNGYFLNRFSRVVSPRAAPVVAAGLFSGVHMPNLFLMAVTLVAGYCCARIYRRYQNLYFLGAAHGTIGFLLFLVIPDSVSHHLAVGPGFLK
jgi:membrane protease YdiL (CAAX protease family)